MTDPSPNENLKEWILELPGLTTATHRFGGTAYQYNGLEFMHSHGESRLDIRLARNDQEKILKEGIALPHRFTHAQAGWVIFLLRSEKDLDNAKLLIQLAYDNAKVRLGPRILKTPIESKLS